MSISAIPSSSLLITTDQSATTNKIISSLKSNENSIRQNIQQIKADENLQHDSPHLSQFINHSPIIEFNSINNNQYKCSLTSCPNELNPICDTEGTIYINDCLLKKYFCQKINNGELPKIISCNSTIQSK
ncbi:unnamed protein product [Schistosoma curassoni]|uniref:Kazal-like domain-containing protein n=1 Tax=Schistosoma curassoni TaxID=6186 RepID=A0A183KTH8_9TREM|nr:unnamed protein product [Schistosoma curassoni]